MSKQIKWTDTVASKCRWSEYIAPLFSGYDTRIILDASEHDYQGSVEVLAIADVSYGDHPDQPCLYVEYSYGSCSGCDGWENENPARIYKDMAKLVMPLTVQAAIDLLKKRREQAYDSTEPYDKAIAELEAEVAP